MICAVRTLKTHDTKGLAMCVRYPIIGHYESYRNDSRLAVVSQYRNILTFLTSLAGTRNVGFVIKQLGYMSQGRHQLVLEPI